jgi:hypothetical protein
VWTVPPRSTGFDACQPDRLVSIERSEQPDRVRTPTDARNDFIREAVTHLQHLRACFAPDDRLELRYQLGIGMRPDDRADHVMRVLDMRDPVTKCFVDRVLEGRRPRLDGHHPCTKHAHTNHVQVLAAHVRCSHVDDARQPEVGRRSSRGDAVLSRAGLGDDPALTHPHGEQYLSERVVDLVRSGVCEVLPLQEDMRADALREPLCVVHGRGTTDHVAQQPVEFACE